MAAMARLLRIALLLARCAAAARHTPWEGEEGSLPDAASVELPRDLVRQVLAFLPPRFVHAFGSKVATMWVGNGANARQPWLWSQERIVDVKFLPGESRVLLAGAEGASAIWDLASSRMSVLLRGGHLAEVLVYEAQALPDGERVVTLGSDMLAVVWNASSGEVLQRLQLRGVCRQHHVVRALFGDLVVTGVGPSSSDAAVVWNASDGAALRRLKRADRTSGLAVSPCGRKIGTAGFLGLWLWDAASGKLEHRLHRVARKGFALSRGADVVLGVWQQSIFVWAGATGRLLRTVGVAMLITALALFPDGRRAAVFTPSEAAVWDVASGERLLELHGGALDGRSGDESFAVLAAGDAVAACSGDVWRPTPLEMETEGDDMWDDDFAVEVSASLWDATTGRLLHHTADMDLRSRFIWQCSIAIGAMNGPWLEEPAAMAQRPGRTDQRFETKRPRARSAATVKTKP